MSNAKELIAQEDALYGKITTEQYNYIRRKAKYDLFFLCYSILNYKKLSPNLHGHMCRWIQQTQDKQFREILIPRGHYKSTVLTIGDSIRIVLPDDSGDAPWPLNLGTNCRLLICHEVHTMAARFLVSITDHFERNPKLTGLFPEAKPRKGPQRINQFELELPRTEIWNEPTIDTMGVGGKAQGRHYNYLKLDDLFGDKARDSAAERLATYTWFDNIQSFFSTFKQDKFDLIGTRWGFDDLYAHAHNMYGDLLVRYIRSCEEKDPDTGEIRPIFPEEFPTEKLAVLKRNPKVWSAQYANDPREGAAEFEKGWIKYYTWEGFNRLKLPDGNIVNLRDCDIIILIDPAPSGNSGWVITATDKNKRIFVLESEVGQWKAPALVEKIFNAVIRWQPRLVAIESVNFSEIYQHWIIQEQARRGIRFRVAEAKTRQKSKEARVRGLSNYLSAGHIYLTESQTQLITEISSFGAISEYHILDALAYGPDFWRAGLDRNSFERNAELAEHILAHRDVSTGYSRIR